MGHDQALSFDLRDLQASVDRSVDAVASVALMASDVAVRRAELEADQQRIQQELADLRTDNAVASMLSDISEQVISASTRDTAREVAETVRAKVTELPLEDQRALLRGYVGVVVTSGRGAKRVHVTPDQEG